MSERYEKRICQNPVCGKIFYADIGGRTYGVKPYPIRQKRAKTCCTKCSNARNSELNKIATIKRIEDGKKNNTMRK